MSRELWLKFKSEWIANRKLHRHNQAVKVYLGSDHVRRAPWSPDLSKIGSAATRGDWCCPSGAGHVQGQTHTCHRLSVWEPGVVQTGWPETLPSGCRGSSPSSALFSDTERGDGWKKWTLMSKTAWDKRSRGAHFCGHWRTLPILQSHKRNFHLIHLYNRQKGKTVM